MMTKSGLVVAAVLGVAVYADPAAAECPMGTCGGNGTVLYGHDINGLNVRGEPNVDGHRLVHDSIRLGASLPWPCRYHGPPNELRLAVVNNRLVIKKHASILGPGGAFSGACLIGATFTVEVSHGRNQPPSSFTDLRIDAVDYTSSWHAVPSQRRRLEMYRIVPVKPGVLHEAQTSICNRADWSWMEDWQVGGLTCDGAPEVCHNPRADEVQWHDATDMAFVVSGEVYVDDDDAGLKVIAGQEGPDWFQFACPRSSLSKMAFMGFNLNDRARRPVRLGMMNMLAARYDGKTSMTTTGKPLQYELVQGPKFLGTPDPTKIYPGGPEAYWGASGALCLSHMRTWMKKPNAPEGYYGPPILGPMPDNEQGHIASIKPQACPPAPPAEALWTSKVVDHITH